jgi:hypothetical protein
MLAAADLWKQVGVGRQCDANQLAGILAVELQLEYPADRLFGLALGVLPSQP